MAFSHRKHGKVLAAEPEPKAICDKCGCQFTDENGYGETTCLDCVRTEVKATEEKNRAKLARERGRILLAIADTKQKIRALWLLRKWSDPRAFRPMVTTLRSLYTCLEICLALHNGTDNLPSWGDGSSPYLKSPEGEGPGFGGLWGNKYTSNRRIKPT
jgi:hypothetical protein